MRLYLAPDERRPDPEPLRTDDRKAVLVGTAAWAVLLVAGLVAQDRLAAAGRAWWIWTAVAGTALGLLGLGYLHQREVRRRRQVSAGDGTARPGRAVREPSPPRSGR